MKAKLAGLMMLMLLMIASSGPRAEDEFRLPADAAAFKEKRDLCEHFRGEPAYDEERRQFLLKNIVEFCKGTDADLAKLKEKYKDNAIVIRALSAYEEDIEPGD